MIHLQDLLIATDGRLCGPPRASAFAGFAFDSRIIEPGELFIAVVTERGDGHDYIGEAVRGGAEGVLCQDPPKTLPRDVTCVVVEDSQQALLAYARHVIAQRDVQVIGVTGSVGKTSVKDAIASVLGERMQIFKSPESYNGRFGLPIALGSLGERQRIAVLEMACDGLGEIAELAALVRPRIGVVTEISPSHLRYLGSMENIAREKGRLIEALPADGVAVLNFDDLRVRAMASVSRAPVLSYGLKDGADLVGRVVSVSARGVSLDVSAQHTTERLEIPLIGEHHAYTALAAACVGLAYGLSWEAIRRGLREVRPLPGRTRLLDGINGSRILDDSYNSSPSSARAALHTLAALPAERRIALLGDMPHLGDQAEEAHRTLGAHCAQAADLLITKGELARVAAESAQASGLPQDRIQITYTWDDAVRALKNLLREGDLVLIKGGDEARLEFVTREILAQPQLVAEVLPRQNRGWQQVRIARPERPTWVEIDLEAIGNNVRRIAQIVGSNVQILAVLKADGYGHGAAKVAHTVLNNGAHWLGVACLGEAIALRQAGIDAPILALGYTPPWQAREAVLHDVITTLFAVDVASALSRAAQDIGRTARCHVKVDTGMGRLGVLPEEAPDLIRQLHHTPGIEVDGIYTHMAAADDADLGYTLWQLEQFETVLRALRADGLLPARIHAANSAALLRVPEAHYNMVRPGIALYGLSPSPETPCPEGFRSALAFKCQVAQVKDLPTGSYVSYGRAFRTQRPSRIAVIPVGYADGFRRAPQGWHEVLVRGQRAPIVGRVCMDQTMIDVTDIPGVRSGDEVVLIGSQYGASITVDEVAAHLGTINYEVVSEILARVPRVV